MSEFHNIMIPETLYFRQTIQKSLARGLIPGFFFVIVRVQS